MIYYASRKSKLLKDFDRTAALVQDYLVQNYGLEFAETLCKQARQEYEKLIPQVPFIPGARARALNSFLRITAQEVAVYKAMAGNGKTPDEAWELCHLGLKERLKNFSKIKRWLLKHLMHSRFLMRRVKKRVARQQQLKFGDFEIRYVLGDGTDYDWGVDYLSCGNYNIAKAHGAEEFAPYICMSDIALSDALDWGLIRTQTLADGCTFCDFRFKKGGINRISSKTPQVQATIERIRMKES